VVVSTDTSPRSITVVFEGLIPAALRPNVRAHHMSKYRQGKAVMNTSIALTREEMMKAGGDWPLPEVVIRVKQFWWKKPFDPDNLIASVKKHLDGMKYACAFLDDNPGSVKSIVAEYEEVKDTERRLEITIEEYVG
jgi:Holliday junction resolvase RusA-like endonuclease